MTPILIFAIVVWLIVSVADAYLSIKIQALGGVEVNPILGEHPCKATIITFCLLSIGVFTSIGLLWCLPDAGPNVAAFFFAVGSLLRAFVVLHNAREFAKQKKINVK